MGKSNASCIDQGLTAEHQDLLMDWSLLRPHARFIFLREELLYSSHIPVCANLIIGLCAPTDSPTTVLLSGHREEFITLRIRGAN